MEWISVKDRLPPEDGTYLVVFELLGTGNSIIDVYYINPELSYLFEGFQPINTFFYRKITHWMELPELP